MPPQLAKLSAALIQKANKKESIRAEVNQRNGANAFAYYSELNRDALDIVNESILRINNESVRDHLAVMYYLARLKEHLGQVRGKLNGVLAKKYFHHKRSVKSLVFIMIFSAINNFSSVI